MAVRQRQNGLGKNGGVPFTSRLPSDIYKMLEDFAWQERLTLAAAVSKLVAEGLSKRNEK